TVDGVLFVDDGLSTNVLPTLAALAAFPGRRVALIVGGQDRGIDYGPLAEGVAGRDAPTLVAVTDSEAGPRIRAALAGGAGGAEVVACPDLEAATRRAFAWARPDGVVLLSPAAPSFDRYRDYRDRARAFRAAVEAVRAGTGRQRRRRARPAASRRARSPVGPATERRDQADVGRHARRGRDPVGEGLRPAPHLGRVGGDDVEGGRGQVADAPVGAGCRVAEPGPGRGGEVAAERREDAAVEVDQVHGGLLGSGERGVGRRGQRPQPGPHRGAGAVVGRRVVAEPGVQVGRHAQGVELEGQVGGVDAGVELAPALGAGDDRRVVVEPASAGGGDLVAHPPG